MKKRLFTLLLTLVLIVTCVTPITASAARITQEYAVVNLLRWAKYTQAEADIVGGWIELAYYVDLVLDTDNFDPDAPCTTAYYNTLRKRANHLFRNKIPVYPIVKIDTQPQSSSVELGDDMILIADASISDGTDTAYQWYSCADANKTAATAIRGATGQTLTVAPKETGVYYYFCRFSAKTAENVQPLDSDVVCVTVTKAYITVVTQPENLTPDRGGEATLTASASSTNGRKVSYQWYSCTDKLKTDATPIEGATDSVLNVPTDMYGDYYYFCRFSAEKLADVDSDVVCVDVPFMKYENGLAQPILTYTDASVETYTNEGSDIVRFCVYVETDYDTDGDGKLDLVKAVVQLPRAAMEGAYQAAVIYEARPYCAGENKGLTGIEGSFDNSRLYSTAAPRTKNGSATTAEVVAAADASDFYFYENLDWYDYFLVRGYAVVLSAGPGTRGSEGFETCGSDLETDAFACIIEWLAGKEGRVAYTDKTSNIAIEADWCNGQVGMTGRSYAGTTQFGLATTGVEGLETIVPVAGLADWYEISCAQGMYLRTDAYADYLAGLCASRYQDSSDWANIAKNYQYYLWHLDNDEETLYGSYGEKGGFWDIRNNTRNAANIKCPALIVHGLNDTVVYQKHFALMYDSYKKAGVDAKLLLTQNGHLTPAFGENKTEQYIGNDLYQQVLNRWFTYYLYDIDNGADEMAAVTVQDNVDGSWDTYPSWETNQSMTMAFSPNEIISNYDSDSGITKDNFVTTYTARNTDYSTVKVIDINEDTTIGGTIQVSVTATPQTAGENLMLTAFLVDMSEDEFNAFVIDKSGGNFDKNSHEATGEIFDIGGGAESYTVVKLKPKSVTSKIITVGWIDLANPSAGYYSHTAVDEGEATLEEHTYNIYLNPTIYTVKEGHKLALVICTRDPNMNGYYKRPYHNMNAEYSVLISDVKATIPVY